MESLARKYASELMPEALSLQYCNFSNENDLKAPILQRRAALSR